jgi:N-acetylmuramoyl-L-alanine amidase
MVNLSVSKFNGIKIVLDAGHGGRDGGSVGVNGTIEKNINLEYTLELKDKLIENGYMVELTRKDDSGLYSSFDKNKKQSDMNNRFKIIKRTNPNLVISIHMNSYTSSLVKGASTYYRKGDESGKQCADLIQKSLYKNCGARIQEAKVGDYYMLNCSYYTAVLIECGFLSNPEEERLLNDEKHKKKIIDAIFNGILLYFGNNQI